MPIIHNFTDKQERRLNIRVLSWFLIIVGVILLTYFLSKQQFPKKEVPELVLDDTSYLCISSKEGKLIEYLNTEIDQKSLDLKIREDRKENCTVEIIRNPIDTNALTLVWQKLFVIVTNVKSKESTLQTETIVTSLNSQKMNNKDLIWNREVDEFLRTKYSFGVGQTIYSDEQIKKKLTESTQVYAIVPFEMINPQYKILKIDHWDILSSSFSLSTYPFSDSYWYMAKTEFKESLRDILVSFFPKENFEANKFTKLILTGSSFVGADAYNINILDGQKPDYMVENLKNTIGKGDILHISNEVSTYNSCLQKINSTYLCSFEKDLLPLKTLGTDVVGVTGNHIMDFGYNTYNNTLNWYTENKMKYFGGGKNESDAHTPKVVGKNGIKFAFLGYNFVPPYSYYSTPTRAGSANVSLKFMKDDISKAKKLADFVVIDMQWGEEEQTNPNDAERENATYALKYGATIVNGVNSFSPNGFDLTEKTSTFYGLGGFLNPQAKEGIFVTHIFYKNNYIALEVTPIVYDSKKRIQLAVGKEKDRILDSVYKQTSIIYDKN